MKRILAGVGVIAAASVAVYVFAMRGETDWHQQALDDVEAIHQALREGHPGTVDPGNPGFLETLEAAHALAVARAETVTDAAGHFYVKRGFTAAFHDVHVADQLYTRPERNRRWPGFAIALDGVGHLSVFLRESDAAPPSGAVLVSCDGESPDALFDRIIAPFFHGSWLAANRGGDLPYLLIDSANPFVTLPQVCRFAHDGSERDYTLDWVPVSDARINEIIDATEPRVSQTTGLRFLEDGTAWVSIASFADSDPATAAELDALIAAIGADRERIAAAPALVVDVRGNGGGASAAGYRVAGALWGEGYVQDRLPRFTATEWRASAYNLDRVDGFLGQIGAAVGEDDPLYLQVSGIRDGLAAAIAAGEDFFVQRQDQPALTGAGPADLPARQFFLTDAVCVSACLDFADLMHALPGVVQIGQETGGDTSYLEVVFADLPSRTGRIAYPAAIHSGRARGDNETWVPVHAWTGSIADTAAIEAWVATLPDAG